MQRITLLHHAGMRAPGRLLSDQHQILAKLNSDAEPLIISITSGAAYHGQPT
jgi:hypothetical protein